MIRVGLDLSLNSTGVTVILSDADIRYYLIVPKMTKKQSVCTYINYRMYDKSIPDKNSSYIEKECQKTHNIIAIVDQIESILFKELKLKECIVSIEGIAFGGSGDVVGLSGLNYQVRYMLCKHGLQSRIISPMQNKKYAVGNGGADKDVMVDAFQRCTGFKNDLGVKIDDIADAYFLAIFDEE